MSNVVHRNEFRVLRRVTAERLAREFADPPWALVSDADLDALIGAGNTAVPDVPFRYWIFDPPGSASLREMTPAEKATVDVQAPYLAEARREKLISLAVQRERFFLSRNYPPELRAHFQALAWQTAPITSRFAALSGWFTWVESVLAAWHQATVDVATAPDVPSVQAVTIDFAALSAADPGLTLAQVMAL